MIEKNAWRLAVQRSRRDVHQKMWDWAEENLTTQEIKNELLLVRSSEGETVWHFAAVRSKLDFWEWAKENLTREEIKNNLLLDTDREGRTAWDRATERGH